MSVETQHTPSLVDLTFDVEPRREWTPPKGELPMAKLWDTTVRNVSSTASATTTYRPSMHNKPLARPFTDTRVYDIRRANPPPILTPPQSMVTPLSPVTSAPPSPQPHQQRPHHPQQPQHEQHQQLQPKPASPTRGGQSDDQHHTSYPPSYASGGGLTPRRRSSTLSPPVRVVFAEPSLSQLSLAELPAIRGQTVSSLASPSPTGGSTLTNMGSIGAGGVGGGAALPPGAGSPPRGGRPLAALGSGMGPEAQGGGGGGYSLADHLSAMSSHFSGNQDPVDAYLARFQIHQRIKDQFRVRQDEHFRTVQELGARIQAMTRLGSATSLPDTHTTGGTEARDEAGSPPTSTPRSPRSPLPLPPPPSAGPSQSQGASLSGQHLPDHPLLPRNRFMPPTPHLAAAVPASTLATVGGGGGTSSPGGHTAATIFRPASAASASSSSRNSPGRCASAHLLRSGLTADGAELTAVTAAFDFSAAAAAAAAALAAATHGSSSSGAVVSPRAPHPQQGAYLALPDGSFAASVPLRGQPVTEGLLFEKYSRRSQAVELPELQLRYIRPGTVAPREPRQLRRVPRQPAPPARALPNGIPASRLERLSARRRERSPPRAYQQHHQQMQQPNQLHQLPQDQRPELLRFSGVPVPASAGGSLGGSPRGTFSGGGAAGGGGGLAAVGDRLFRSSSLVTPGAGGATGRGRAASAAAAEGGGGTLSQYLSVCTAAASGEPLLDENFYEVLQLHFRSSLHQQTHQLRAQLNVNLPLVLGALNCVNATEPVKGMAAAAAAAADAAAAGKGVAAEGGAMGGSGGGAQ